jgi:hypothetical protein
MLGINLVIINLEKMKMWHKLNQIVACDCRFSANMFFKIEKLVLKCNWDKFCHV